MKQLTTCLLIGLLCLQIQAHAQQENTESKTRGFDIDRVFFGGNMGLRFSEAFYLDLSPLVGYQLTERFSSGLGVTYRYFKVPERVGYSIYGGRLFSRFDLYKPFFIYTEYETLNIATEYVDNEGKYTNRKWVPSWFAGAGILQPLGRGVGLSVSLMYNMLFDEDDGLYARPYVIRAGVVILPRW